MNKEKENKNAEISARIAEILQYTGDTRNGFAIKLGYERAQTVYDVMNMKSAPSYDFFRRFSISEYSDIIDLRWLLSGEGSMVRVDGVPTIFDTPSTDTSAQSNTVVLRLMDKLDEKDAENKQLQSELRQKSEELAALKAKYQDKESGFKFPNPTEAFTSESSGDYGEGYSSTRKPTTSARSSAGKI